MAGSTIAGGLDEAAEVIEVGIGVGGEIERLLLATSGLAQAVSAVNAAAAAVPAAPMGVTC